MPHHNHNQPEPALILNWQDFTDPDTGERQTLFFETCLHAGGLMHMNGTDLEDDVHHPIGVLFDIQGVVAGTVERQGTEGWQ